MNQISLDHNEEEAIARLLIGKSVTKVADDQLLLSDGTTVQIIPNEGGCSCGAGDYSLEHLGDSPNVITAANVTVQDEEDESTTYRIFVYSEGVSSELARVVGDDGNGYYGTGFSIEVSREKD